MGKFIDISGMKFNRLLVIERVEDIISSDGNKRPCWKCLCDCGNYKCVEGSNLRNGYIKSCGCLLKENKGNPNIKYSTKNKKHGDSTRNNHTRLYCVWQAMKSRCYNPNNKRYDKYGGRGIIVCDEWLHDYKAFKKWSYENGYNDQTDGLHCSIDRIDNDKGYSPNNCRWVTMFVQANNTRRNHIIEYNGESHTLAEWSRIVGIDYKVLSSRINRYNWPIEKALKTPVKNKE